MGNNDEGFNFKANAIFPSKESAIDDMKIAIKSACDFIQEQVIGKVTGEYIDMKTNETMKWDKTKHN